MVGEPLGPMKAGLVEAVGVGPGDADGVVGEGVSGGVPDGTAVGVGLQPTAMMRRRASTTGAGRRGCLATERFFTLAR